MAAFGLYVHVDVASRAGDFPVVVLIFSNVLSRFFMCVLYIKARVFIHSIFAAIVCVIGILYASGCQQH